MLLMRLFRVLHLGSIVALFLLKALFIHLFTTDSHRRRKKFAMNVSQSCQKALKSLNIDLEVTSPPNNHGRYLIVCNHLGYLDIFALAASVPALFVTSVEMKETPFLGLLTEMAGCMYVERRSRMNIHNEIKEIEEALNDGFNVILFPEGKSTDGEKVLPFKKSLLMACAGSDANIMPAVVNFKMINGEPMQHKFRDWVCWYGTMPFITSIWNASKISQSLLRLDFLGEVVVNGDSDHRDVAQRAQSQVESNYIGVPYPPGTGKTY
ncbi:MAG: hypothetical protein RJB66_704 [Pseudomonadota bacterium]|jgi:1-acyl-sn-glycerol-3-phosphate acyltransferase